MKRRLAMLVLLALALAMAAPALAEEESIETDDLLGVWKTKEIEDLTVVILPGSYAPVENNARKPDLYVEGSWRESADKEIEYFYMLNQWKPSDNGFLNSLLGNTMAKAIQGSGALGNSAENENSYVVFEYEHGLVGVDVYFYDDEYEYAIFTEEASGSFYGFRDADGALALFWMDNYDPHIVDVVLHRMTADVPSAEEAAQGLLRPVIDMAEGAEAQAAIDVLRWAVKHQCARMDNAALTQGLRTAYAALAPADAQAFRDHYAKISALLLDGMGLNSKTLSDPNRLKPFTDANLDKALSELNKPVENRRAADLLNAAVAEVLK